MKNLTLLLAALLVLAVLPAESQAQRRGARP